MPQDFLSIVKRRYGDGNYAGDEHGGASGSDGNGLPTGGPGNFMFATGIECSNPTIDNGRTRRDQLEECGHYARWRDDLRLTRDLGLKVLRYGLPIHRIYLGPGKYDWEFADLVMAELQRLGLTPILDLLHFGVPDWIGNCPCILPNIAVQSRGVTLGCAITPRSTKSMSPPACRQRTVCGTSS